MPCLSSTDWDGTETLELWLGRADWKDEVSPTICDDQVGSNITSRIVSVLCLRFKGIMTFLCNRHLPSFIQVVLKFLVFIVLMAADSHRAHIIPFDITSFTVTVLPDIPIHKIIPTFTCRCLRRRASFLPLILAWQTNSYCLWFGTSTWSAQHGLCHECA